MATRNQNKSFLQSLRVLVAAASIGGFVGGWALFAQANASTTTSAAPIQTQAGNTTSSGISVEATAAPVTTNIGTTNGVSTQTTTQSTAATAVPTTIPATATTSTNTTTTANTRSQTKLRTGGS